MAQGLTDPTKIAEAAEAIYDEKYREGYEADHNGEFVAIDVTDQKAYLGEHAEDALLHAREQAPHGVFHLMKVGATAAFKLCHVDRQRPSSAWHWPLRSLPGSASE